MRLSLTRFSDNDLLYGSNRPTVHRRARLSVWWMFRVFGRLRARSLLGIGLAVITAFYQLLLLS